MRIERVQLITQFDRDKVFEILSKNIESPLRENYVIGFYRGEINEFLGTFACARKHKPRGFKVLVDCPVSVKGGVSSLQNGTKITLDLYLEPVVFWGFIFLSVGLVGYGIMVDSDANIHKQHYLKYWIATGFTVIVIPFWTWFLSVDIKSFLKSILKAEDLENK